MERQQRIGKSVLNLQKTVFQKLQNHILKKNRRSTFFKDFLFYRVDSENVPSIENRISQHNPQSISPS